MLIPILLFGGTMALSLWASARVKSAYRRYSQLPASSGLTGAQAAQRILDLAGIRDVEIVGQDGMLSDHYDPMHKRLVLSRDNFEGRSVAALGVAAHECGHAIQHKIAYKPLNWRMAAVGLTNFVSPLLLYIPMIGMALGFLAPKSAFLLIGIGYGVVTLFNLVTLPVEFDATKRAKVILGQSGMVAPGEEEQGVARVLNAAGWTYVAAFISSLAYMLYYLLPALLGNRN